MYFRTEGHSKNIPKFGGKKDILGNNKNLHFFDHSKKESWQKNFDKKDIE